MDISFQEGNSLPCKEGEKLYDLKMDLNKAAVVQAVKRRAQRHTNRGHEKQGNRNKVAMSKLKGNAKAE